MFSLGVREPHTVYTFDVFAHTCAAVTLSCAHTPRLVGEIKLVVDGKQNGIQPTPTTLFRCILNWWQIIEDLLVNIGDIVFV